MNIAIIGAGLSGAVLTHQLQSKHPVTLLEKSRGAGGRLATRRQEHQAWDHGAPYFTARSLDFQRFLEPAKTSGVIADWKPNIKTLSHRQKPFSRLWFEPHLISQPSMKSWIQDLITPNQILTETEVLAVTGAPGHWFLTTKDNALGPFDWVFSTAPSPQSQLILAPFLPDLGATYAPGLTLLAKTTTRPQWQMATCKDPIVDQIIFMDSRADRQAGNAVVIHAQRDWAKAHLEQPLDQSKAQIEQALLAICELKLIEGSIHRWRYAKVEQPATRPYWLDLDLQLGACGDWGGSQGVESAFTSARQLFSAFTAHLDRQAGSAGGKGKEGSN
jgi:predicted NAD/FAD-dependent oxidoreductase